MSLKARSTTPIASRNGIKKQRDSYGPTIGSAPLPTPPVEPNEPYLPIPPSYGPPISNGCSMAEIAIVKTAKIVEELKEKVVEEVHEEVKKEIKTISTEVIGLLTLGEEVEGAIVVEKGEHFLEVMMRKFQLEFFEKWKTEFLFPRIQRWLEVFIVEFIKNTIHERTEKIVKKFEESIEIIEKKYEVELIEIERHHRELLLVIIKKAWHEYEKKMTETEVIKEVRFKFSAKETKEAWGEIIEEILPDLVECVPRVYAPEVHLHDHNHPDHHHNHNHNHKRDDVD